MRNVFGVLRQREPFYLFAAVSNKKLAFGGGDETTPIQFKNSQFRRMVIEPASIAPSEFKDSRGFWICRTFFDK